MKLTSLWPKRPLESALVHVGGKEPGLIREPGKMRHLELTGIDDGHAETSESGAE